LPFKVKLVHTDGQKTDQKVQLLCAQGQKISGENGFGSTTGIVLIEIVHWVH
jgi:hypothetical protein